MNVVKRIFTSNAFIIAITIILNLYLVYISQRFVAIIGEGEREKVELWAEAIKVLSQAEVEPDMDFAFIHNVVERNTSVPCILMSEDGELLSSKNVPKKEIDTKIKLDERLKKMTSYNKPIEINIPNEGTAYMYYENSVVQKMLKNFPIFLTCAISLFILLIYVVVSTNNKTEQNKLWIGISKELAHQLGTPISSLLGWVEVLREKNQEIAEDIEKDIIRLEKVSIRFSKIGSIDNVYIIDTIDIIKNGISYANRRKATNITIIDKTGGEPIFCRVNETLWEWVIENLFKNAIDAIGVEHGTITVSAQIAGTVAYFDFSDTGKGISAKVYRHIFTPGYTTKSRGWGLGLSLCRRIIEDYYHGKIFVLQSELGKGTTLRVILPIAN